MGNNKFVTEKIIGNYCIKMDSRYFLEPSNIKSFDTHTYIYIFLPPSLRYPEGSTPVFVLCQKRTSRGDVEREEEEEEERVGGERKVNEDLM